VSRRHDQSGFSLVEAVVAVAVLAIVLVPTIHLVIVGQLAANQQRFQAEASTIATQAIEELQDEAGQGYIPNGSTTQTVKAGNDVFTVRLTFTATSHGTSQTYCTSAANSTPGTWIATAAVSWHGMNGAPPLTESTELAPGVAGAIDGSAGTIAVPILDALAGTPFANALIPVTVTLTGTWTKGPGTAPSQPPVPTGEITSGSVNTVSGCAVFLGVDPDPGWTYILSVNNVSNSASGGAAELINSGEESYDNPSPIPTIGPYVSQAGEPTLASGFQIDQGATVGVSFSATGFSATTSKIPVTVDNSGLGGSDTYVFGGGTFGGYPSTGGNMYLFPYASAYTAWAGDQTTSNPAASCGAVSCYPGAAAAPSVAAIAGGSSVVSLPLYDLVLHQSGAAASTALTAQDAAAPATIYNLKAPSAGTSSTGLPLGQYIIDSSPVEYIWLTPTGMCSSASLMATTCASPSSTPVAVT